MKRQYQTQLWGFVALSLMVHAINAGAQDSRATQKAEEEPPFVVQMEYLVRDGGEWLAKNKNYNPDDQQSPHTFGYKYEWGLHKKIAKLRIYGLYKNGKRIDCWECIYAWHPVEKKTYLYNFGAGGDMVSGEEIVIADSTTQTTLSGFRGNGEQFTFRDVSKILGPDEFISSSFNLADGQWKKKSDLTWRRVRGEKMN